MFKKYIFNSIKKYPLKYVAIAICEVLLLVISLFSSCVLLERLSKTEAENPALLYSFSFSKLAGMSWSANSKEAKEMVATDTANLPNITNMRERIYELCSRSPIKIDYVGITPAGWEKNYYYTRIIYFPSYENLVYYFTESNKPAWSVPKNMLPTEQQYLNKEKVVVLGMGASHNENGEYVYSDENHLLIGKNDDEYLIAGTSISNIPYIFFGTEPDYLKLSDIDFLFAEYPTQKQIDEFTALFTDIVAPDIEITYSDPPHIKDLLEIRKEIANIVITTALLLISSFNILAIFKMMTEERRTQYAVFRVCGYGKFKAILFPFAEIISFSGICAVLSCGIFAALTPLIKTIFPVVSAMFDFGFYAVFVLGFLVVTAVLFMIYILPSLNKTVSEELREM